MMTTLSYDSNDVNSKEHYNYIIVNNIDVILTSVCLELMHQLWIKN